MFKFFGCFILIFIMVTMPVMATFNPCTNKNLNTEKPLMTMTTSFESNQQAIHSPLQKHSKSKMQHCHSMTHCSFHLCSVHYYPNYYRLYSITVASVYSHSENALLNSFSHSPELRPPIS
ncbi:MAG: hypothetical protein Q9M50_00540 [Methylococcales bacterium]|nr:hypothetical protein [Methylococcales bacterium]